MEPSTQNPAPNVASRGGEGPILTASLLAWIGAVICFLLLQKHLGIESFLCSSRAGCDAILSSRYSILFGVPLPWLGLAFYLVILVMLLCVYATGSTCTKLLQIIGWLTTIAFCFSATLMFFQFKVLHGFCPLCTSSAFITLCLFAIIHRVRSSVAAGRFSGSRWGAFFLGGFALVSGAVLAISEWAPKNEVVAVVDGRKFTKSEMANDLELALLEPNRTIFEAESNWIKTKVNQALLRAEADRLKISVASLLVAQVDSQIHISETDIQEKLKARGLPDIENNIDAIRAGLVAKEQGRLKDELLSRLNKTHYVEIYPRNSGPLKIPIDLSTAKITGPLDAKVQLVVFSDFQCSFCAKLAPVVAGIIQEFPDEVMVAFRYFPLNGHDRAIPAAVAAECAAEQGAFWKYHDALFAKPDDLSDARFLFIATALRLNGDRFQECLKSDRPRKVVETSLNDAMEKGLSGAPAVFINGTMIDGVVDHDRLVTEIRRRLHREDNAPAGAN